MSNGLDVYTDAFQIIVDCSSSYGLIEAGVTNPTFVTHGSSYVGFNLPTYIVGNPSCTVTRSVSSTTGTYTAHTQLNQPLYTGGTNY